MRLLSTLVLLSLLCVNAFSVEDHLLKDDIDGKVHEKKSIKNPLLSDNLKFLEEEYHLNLIFSYMTLGQKDTVSGEQGYGDRVDFVAHYTPVEALSFGAKVELQRAYGEYTSGQFANAVGAINKLSPSYADLDTYVKELWGDYRSDKLFFRAGIINTSSFVDKSFYNSFAKFYMSHASSSQDYGSIPLSSLGVGIKYTEEAYYINAVLSDATVHLRDAIDDIRDNNLSLYSTIEIGYTPGKDIYFINLWDKEDKEGKHSYGAYLSLNHYIDEQNKIYAKYGYTGYDVDKNTSIRQHISLGWSHSALFSSKDLLLTAFAFSQEDITLDYQNSIEILYKYTFDHGIELSADLQIIQHPTTEEDWIVIPGVRLRAVF